jgi:hypothetical protein
MLKGQVADLARPLEGGGHQHQAWDEERGVLQWWRSG